MGVLEDGLVGHRLYVGPHPHTRTSAGNPSVVSTSRCDDPCEISAGGKRDGQLQEGDGVSGPVRYNGRHKGCLGKQTTTVVVHGSAVSPFDP